MTDEVFSLQLSFLLNLHDVAMSGDLCVKPMWKWSLAITGIPNFWDTMFRNGIVKILSFINRYVFCFFYLLFCFPFQRRGIWCFCVIYDWTTRSWKPFWVPVFGLRKEIWFKAPFKLGFTWLNFVDMKVPLGFIARDLCSWTWIG